jgi:putative redox protein
LAIVNNDTASQPATEPESVHLSEGKHGPFEVVVRSGSATFIVDEPFGAGGLGAGPTPFDLLSAALGACALMTMRLYASELGWPLEHIVVRVSHHREGLTDRDRFVEEIQLVGDLTEVQRQVLVEVATRCPIHLTLARGSDIETCLLKVGEMLEGAVSRTAHIRGMRDAIRGLV